MAEKRAELIITLKDMASAGVSKLSGGLETLRANFLAVSAAVGGLVALGASAVKSYLESEAAVNKLNVALKNQGIFSDELSKEMQAYSSQLQKTTAFSDEAVTETQALLTTFGLAGSNMKQATQAALDLSTGLGVDLKTATMILGKSFSGETGTLSKYGITIDESIPRAEKFDEVLRQLNTRFGGSAQAQLNTTIGQFEAMKNQFDDMKESIGQGMIPVITFYLQQINTILEAYREWGGLTNTLKIVSLEFAKSIIEGIVIALEQLPILGSAFQLLGIDLDGVNAKLDEQIAKIQNNAVTEGQIESQRLLRKQITTKSMIDLEKKWTDEAAKESEKRGQKVKDEIEKKMALEIDSIQRRRDADERANQLRAQNWTSTLNFISSLSSAKNKELAAIGKAAAVAQATRDTYAAATLALRSAPPPWGFALAALVTAAGLANVAKISGVEMATGGLVMPRTGGTLATIGEAGSPEAVIPLGDERAMDQMRESGLGGNTINISVGTLVGSDGMREFAKMLDQELFSLRRNNESVAFEAL